MQNHEFPPLFYPVSETISAGRNTQQERKKNPVVQKITRVLLGLFAIGTFIGFIVVFLMNAQIIATDEIELYSFTGLLFGIGISLGLVSLFNESGETIRIYLTSRGEVAVRELTLGYIPVKITSEVYYIEVPAQKTEMIL